MTLPPPVAIEDEEFNRLMEGLSRLSRYAYLPMTMVTGVLIGAMGGTIIGSLLYISGYVTELKSILVFVIFFGGSLAMFFAQRYFLSGVQTILDIFLGQVLALVVITLLPLQSLLSGNLLADNATNENPDAIFFWIAAIIWFVMWLYLSESSLFLSI